MAATHPRGFRFFLRGLAVGLAVGSAAASLIGLYIHAITTAGIQP